MGEQLLPPKWPTGCHEATKLPFCPDFRTYKSSSSNNSGETPKHPRHHRSFSGRIVKYLICSYFSILKIVNTFQAILEYQ